MRSRGILVYSLPAAMLMFCWLTMGITATVDADHTVSYGFPLSWYAPSLVSSASYEISFGHLVTDLIVYIGTVHLVLAWANRRSFGWRSGVVATLLWAATVTSLFFSVAAFAIDPHLTLWDLNPSLPSKDAKAYFVSVGLQPQYSKPQ